MGSSCYLGKRDEQLLLGEHNLGIIASESSQMTEDEQGSAQQPLAQGICSEVKRSCRELPTPQPRTHHHLSGVCKRTGSAFEF